VAHFPVSATQSTLHRRAREGLLLSEPEKRNHALEHGTIHFVHAKYGTFTGIGGRALRHGFRVSGARDPEDIRRAFHELVSLAPEERWRVVVAKKCGSMIVIAQGIGILSLLAILGFFVLMPPSKAALLTLLVGQLLLFLALRRPLGFLIQKRRLLSRSDSPTRGSVKSKRLKRIAYWSGRRSIWLKPLSTSVAEQAGEADGRLRRLQLTAER
jgi:Domain of unknown function (DUF6391)